MPLKSVDEVRDSMLNVTVLAPSLIDQKLGGDENLPHGTGTAINPNRLGLNLLWS